jgi:hypothetical protein
MKNRIFFFVIFLIQVSIYSQELNAQVIVNSDLVNQTNQQIFKTLERSLNEFMNTQVWTNQEYLNQEKITCSFIFNLTGYSNDQFEATLQVQSDQFSFESNLVSLLSFYAYVIIGLDGDTFELNGGSNSYEQALQIVTLAQVTSRKGWKPSDGTRNRFWLIDSLRSNTFREYRQTLYAYHRKGLDKLTTDPLEGKEALMEAIQLLDPLYQRRPNAFLLQVFFDAKVEEIVNLFSEGPKVDFKTTETVLKKIAPFFGSRWKQIKA